MGLFDFLKRKELEEIKRLKSDLLRYKPISDIEAEVVKKRKDLEAIIDAKKAETKRLENDFDTLKSDYAKALETYKKLRNEVSLFESKLDLIEFGIYEPVYDFEKSDDYRTEQNRIIQLQKDMIASDHAAKCDTQWSVQGSEAKGRKVVNIYKKLMLRAFNGECDVLIAKVKWNNVSQMRERMQKLFDAINKLGEDEARTLECALHNAFATKKVNMLNARKEFFNVTLDEIEQHIKQSGFEAEFSRVPEAMEYRETLAMLEKLNSQTEQKTINQLIGEEFPVSL